MCVVLKTSHLNNEYLIAYVETNKNEEDLRQHCLSHLPLYMVPSFFLILEKLPLNQNGKIDRKALPKINFDSLSISSNKVDVPLSEMERRVFELWCQVLPHIKSIPTISASFFSLGGNSLLLMQLFRLYQEEFNQHHVKIDELFRRSTLADHAELLREKHEESILVSDCWRSLKITHGEYISAYSHIVSSFLYDFCT